MIKSMSHGTSRGYKEKKRMRKGWIYELVYARPVPILWSIVAQPWFITVRVWAIGYGVVHHPDDVEV